MSEICNYMAEFKVLEKIGFTKNDKKVYLILLEIGSSTISDLTKKANLHRSYIYDILDKLINLGLVSFTIKNNKKHFNAESPERILKILEEREQEINQDKLEIKKILPELAKKQKTALENQNAKIFLGKQGIKSVLEDILKTKKDFVSFGAEGKFKDIFKWYFDNWQKRRIKMKIKYSIIYNNKLQGKRPTKEQKLIQIRFLPEKYEFPATTIIYGNNVAIIIWDENPICFVLESKKVAKSFKNYFEILWKIAKK